MLAHNIEFSSAAASTRSIWNSELHLPIQTALKATTATICYSSYDKLSCRADPDIILRSKPTSWPYAVNSSAMLGCVDSTSKCNTVAKK